MFSPVTAAGMLWYVVKSAFVSGQLEAQDYMFTLFDEENEEE